MRKRKLKSEIVLPLLVIPFLTLGFWALGGGSGEQKKGESSTGLNWHLPAPSFMDEKDLNKMSFYNRAQRDSLKMAELIKNDPYYKLGVERTGKSPTELERLFGPKSIITEPNLVEKGPNQPAPEVELEKKLKSIQDEIQRSQDLAKKPKNLPVYKDCNEEGSINPDLEKIEGMVRSINSGREADPQVEQISQLMEKIMDVQHPERVKERLKQIERSGGPQYLRMAGEKEDDSTQHFFSIDFKKDNRPGNLFPSSVAETRDLHEGSVLGLRVSRDCWLGEQLLKENSIISGVVNLEGERMLVKINSVISGSNILPVKLTVFDLDGLEGIYVPGSLTRDIAKQSADNGVQSLGVMSLDPSFKGQLAASGVNAAKTLLSRRARQITVHIKAGYKVFLRNEQ